MITARPLRHLGGMTELRELKLAIKRSPVPLRDEDMAFLKQLTRLENLISVLTVLHSWPQLKDLDMRKTNITDAVSQNS